MRVVASYGIYIFGVMLVVWQVISGEMAPLAISAGAAFVAGVQVYDAVVRQPPPAGAPPVDVVEVPAGQVLSELPDLRHVHRAPRLSDTMVRVHASKETTP